MFFTYSEFGEYRKSMEEDSKLTWLPEFEAWLSKYYDVKFMPSSYKQVTTRGMQLHNISLVVMNETDVTGVIFKTCPEDSPERWQYVKEFLTQKANEYALLYQEPIMSDKDCLRVVDVISFLDSYRDFYLFDHLPYQLNSEISSFFEPYNPTYIRTQIPTICVLNTKEEARKFLLSDDIKHIKKQIYDLLKLYDEYDVLKEEDIDIFVDYKERMDKLPMYSRWIDDMSKESKEKHKNHIINGE